MKEVRIGCTAMATRWEIVLYGDCETFLRGVAEEALAEVHRLERQLSLFIPSSETSDVNLHAATGPVVVDPRYFTLLQRAVELSTISDGAFDITVGPLMRCWKFESDTGSIASNADILEALAVVGSHHITLNRANCTVQFDAPGVCIDLGAIGKGYAVECAIDIVRDHGVRSGLLHGGTSTVYALGAPPDADAWSVAIAIPPDSNGANQPIRVLLKDQALSVSAPHGKYFESGGRMYGHVIDPRTGHPTSLCVLAAVITESATDSDALSTALITRGPEWMPTLALLRPDLGALTAHIDCGRVQVEKIGAAVQE